MHQSHTAADRSGLKHDLLQVVRGMCMGGADVIPGVSGGTVALILGIYQRLVTAISHVDLQLLAFLRHRQWRQAARHLDLRFLISLGIGIAIGFLIMTTLMHYLLTDPQARAMTLAAFFGMILASAVLVGMLIRVDSAAMLARVICWALLGAVVAYGLSTLRNANVEPNLAYLFMCGAIAICAMILPGISGAMVLLIMGVYVYLTEIPHELVQGKQILGNLTIVVVFGSGCALGLISFSKFLRWLLSRHEAETMALLCGFMVGALRKIWPFQLDVTPDQPDFKLKSFEATFPDRWDSGVTLVLLSAVLAMGFILAMDWSTRLYRRRLRGRETN
jgi:putative membrane protein